jgi:cyclase
MLRPRVIPCLLIHKSGLVKTVNFSTPKYVGDPINAVRIFNEKEVDEIMIVDIDASVQNREPDYSLIAKIASECRMPLCYGGGIKSANQVERIVALGVEKVAISSAAVTDPNLISDAARRVGNQSIVVVLDVKQTGLIRKSYEIFTSNGRRPSGICPTDLARRAESLGAGELVINSIDRDGTLKGYDFDLIDEMRDSVHLPITALGGAGSYEDIAALIRRYGVIGAAAGSLFVFKGKYRAVLIQYPSRSQKHHLAKSEIASP